MRRTKRFRLSEWYMFGGISRDNWNWWTWNNQQQNWKEEHRSGINRRYRGNFGCRCTRSRSISAVISITHRGDQKLCWDKENWQPSGKSCQPKTSKELKGFSKKDQGQCGHCPCERSLFVRAYALITKRSIWQSSRGVNAFCRNSSDEETRRLDKKQERCFAILSSTKAHNSLKPAS